MSITIPNDGNLVAKNDVINFLSRRKHFSAIKIRNQRSYSYNSTLNMRFYSIKRTSNEIKM